MDQHQHPELVKGTHLASDYKITATELDIKFLNSRGYHADSLESAQSFLNGLKKDGTLAGYLSERDAWKPQDSTPQDSIPEDEDQVVDGNLHPTARGALVAELMALWKEGEALLRKDESATADEIRIAREVLMKTFTAEELGHR
jgi:hypothetical protein